MIPRVVCVFSTTIVGAVCLYEAWESQRERYSGRMWAYLGMAALMCGAGAVCIFCE